MPTHLDNWQTFVTALCLALGIMATRFIPFILFTSKDKLPPVIIYLGRALPHASMTMLLVYCLKEAPVFSSPYGAPEAIAILFTALLQLWRRNVLLSIAGGTIGYMMLVQHVFV